MANLLSFRKDHIQVFATSVVTTYYFVRNYWWIVRRINKQITIITGMQTIGRMADYSCHKSGQSDKGWYVSHNCEQFKRSSIISTSSWGQYCNSFERSNISLCFYANAILYHNVLSVKQFRRLNFTHNYELFIYQYISVLHSCITFKRRQQTSYGLSSQLGSLLSCAGKVGTLKYRHSY